MHRTLGPAQLPSPVIRQIGLLALSLFLVTMMYSPVGRQTANAQPGSQRLYLAELAKGYPNNKKPTSGVHLGSASNQTWTTAMTTRLTGGVPSQGYYPAVLVVLSSDVYNLTRSASSPCYISFVSSTKNQALFNYIRDAAQHGTQVVIRIWPSPGNYENAFGVGSKTLLTGTDDRPLRIPSPPTPVDWCTDAMNRSTKARNVHDIANEILAIRNYNLSQNWSAFGFEAANEPNGEWLTTDPLRLDQQQWVKMDDYFANIYTFLKPGGSNSDIRIFSVPMAQNARAEKLQPTDCTPHGFGDGGLALMTKTWINGSNSPAQSDGWSWHNYWKYGEEASTSDNSCSANSGHVIQAFSDSLKSRIMGSGRPTVISEADLFSPCIGEGAPLLTTKGGLTADSSSANAANAIRQFVINNKAANYVAVWNITIAGSDAETCNLNPANDEFAWHEAFRGTGERAWFRSWWLDNQVP